MTNSRIFTELPQREHSKLPRKHFSRSHFQKQTEDDVKVATLEPHSLSPSYWKFLQRITGGKMGQVGWGGWGPSSTLLLFIHGIFCKYHQVNRILVDYEYGTEAAKQVNSKNLLFFSTAHIMTIIFYICVSSMCAKYAFFKF